MQVQDWKKRDLKKEENDWTILRSILIFLKQFMFVIEIVI